MKGKGGFFICFFYDALSGVDETAVWISNKCTSSCNLCKVRDANRNKGTTNKVKHSRLFQKRIIPTKFCAMSRSPIPLAKAWNSRKTSPLPLSIGTSLTHKLSSTRFSILQKPHLFTKKHYMEDELLSLDVSSFNSEVFKDLSTISVQETDGTVSIDGIEKDERFLVHCEGTECECMGECSLCSSNQIGSADTLARSFTEQEIFEFDDAEPVSYTLTNEIQKVPFDTDNRTLKSNLFFERKLAGDLEGDYYGQSFMNSSKSLPIPIPSRPL